MAVNVGAVATPCMFVTTVDVDTPPANIPLAPVLGAANVTMTPFTGLPPLVTVAISGANAEPVVTLCGVPLVAAIDGAPPPQKIPLTTPFGPPFGITLIATCPETFQIKYVPLTKFVLVVDVFELGMVRVSRTAPELPSTI